MGFCFGRRWWWQDPFNIYNLKLYYSLISSWLMEPTSASTIYALPCRLSNKPLPPSIPISSPFLSLLLFTFGRDEPSTGKDNADSSSFYTLPSNGSSVILLNIDPNLGISSDDGVKVPEIIHSGIELMPRRMLYVLKKMEMTMMTRRAEIIHSGIELMPRRMLYVLKKMEMTMMTRRAKEEMTREMGFRSRI